MSDRIQRRPVHESLKGAVAQIIEMHSTIDYLKRKLSLTIAERSDARSIALNQETRADKAERDLEQGGQDYVTLLRKCKRLERELADARDREM